MHEFLNDGETYENLDEYRKNKADWLEVKPKCVAKTKSRYLSSLNANLKPIEEEKGKDLYKFTNEEISSIFETSKVMSLKEQSIIQLDTVIREYLTWAYNQGLRDSDFNSKSYLINSNIKTKENYENLEEFYKVLETLECSDVDRAIITLLRYGVSIESAVKVEWSDIDRNSRNLMVYCKGHYLKLPVDDLFISIIDKAKSCNSGKYNGSSTAYKDCGYVIKNFVGIKSEKSEPKYMRNRINNLSNKNGISRIDVPGLFNNRLYDLLLEKHYSGIQLTNDHVDEILTCLKGNCNTNIVNSYRRKFEFATGIKINKKKTGMEGPRYKRTAKEEEASSLLKSIDTSEGLIDDEDSIYQREISSSKAKYDDTDLLEHQTDNRPKKILKAVGNNSESYPRDASLGLLALSLANYKCEINHTHDSFISNRTSKNYVEAHHLIPLEYHYLFESDIDNEANIVSICPTCHKILHYGRFQFKKGLITALYNERIDELKKAGLEITLEDLLKIYGNGN